MKEKKTPASSARATPPPSDTVTSHDATPDVAEAAKKDKAPISNYWRVLAFGTTVDHVLLIIALAAAAASGVPVPLFQILFGSLTGEFNSYFTPGSETSEADFKDSIDRYSYV